jgi:hypothetical protein
VVALPFAANAIDAEAITRQGRPKRLSSVVVSTGIAMEGSALVLAAAADEQDGEMALSVRGHGAGCRVRPADALARGKKGEREQNEG